MGMPAAKLTLAEFIEWENAQPERNEFPILPAGP